MVEGIEGEEFGEDGAGLVGVAAVAVDDGGEDPGLVVIAVGGEGGVEVGEGGGEAALLAVEAGEEVVGGGFDRLTTPGSGVVKILARIGGEL